MRYWIGFAVGYARGVWARCHRPSVWLEYDRRER